MLKAGLFEWMGINGWIRIGRMDEWMNAWMASEWRTNGWMDGWVNRERERGKMDTP